MPLSAGARLGPYEIVAPLGAGGMGEVYRARDTTLNRDVAIKVLPDLFASDPDRLARFQREAQVLASLNHPNIAAIYGLEDANGVKALVMELVEGDTLAERLRHVGADLRVGAGGGHAGPPMHVEEALVIARQIADALEAAHEQGIIHRDLKPANIKVRADGTVKVLDFGLAKLVGPAEAGHHVEPGGVRGEPRGVRLQADLTHSPTITTPAMTLQGVILGTAAYMAPEQAKGKAVDKRADIWAFGVVLYEMVTGRRLFDADDLSETLAAVLTRDLGLTALSAEMPARLRTLLRDCLIRDPKQRLRDIGDARIVLDKIIAGAPDTAAASAPVPAVAAGVPVWRRALPWTFAVSTLAFAIAWLAVWAPWRSAPGPTPRKLLASIGADASLPTDLGASAILSPDGTMLAFVARQAGQQTRLFIRKLDQLQAAALAGTENAASPFFSPDGQSIAFFAGGQLKKVSVTGGAAIALCEATQGRGGTWTDDDTIIFSPSGVGRAVLLRISAAGGTPAVFGTPDSATAQLWPQALPGGKGVLYTAHSAAAGFDTANLVVTPMAGGASTIVVRGGYYGRYVPSGLGSPKRDGGHLVYMRQGTLFAVRFDLDRLETVGQAVPAIEGLAANSFTTGGVQLAVSSESTMVYVPGAAETTAGNPIDWMTHDGKTSVLRAAKANWSNPRFSPDGQKLALDIFDGKQRDIFVYEWARNTLTQLTFDAGQDRMPVWTPDGQRIVFQSDRDKPAISNLYWVNADGTGKATRLTDSSEVQVPLSWHPGGKFLVFTAVHNATQTDLMILPMEGDAARGWTPDTPTVFLSTPATEFVPMFSPDGRWIAYASNEAGGAFDVYVRPFPGPGGVWRVSTEGGVYPHWSPTAHELLFVNQTQNRVMVASYAVSGDSFRADTPHVWSPTSLTNLGANINYDVHPDGKRLALAAARDQASVVQDKVVFIFNFFDYLRRLTATTK
jgi:serine/threonine-protein kinase